MNLHRLCFSASDGFWRRATQAAIIEWRLDSHPKEFFVRSVDYQQRGVLIFEIVIKTTAEKLWNEKKIVDMILGYNPKGFTLIFTNAVREFVEDTKPKMPLILFVLIASIVCVVYVKRKK